MLQPATASRTVPGTAMGTAVRMWHTNHDTNRTRRPLENRSTVLNLVPEVRPYWYGVPVYYNLVPVPERPIEGDPILHVSGW